jgi:putative membrane protein
MRALALAAGWLLASSGTAHAHGDGLPIAPSELWHHWSFQWWIWAPLLIGHWLYGRGVLRAWARAGAKRILTRKHVIAFVAGEILLVIALISPLDPLGETLLAAHMGQHILLTTLAPLLLMLGTPALAWTWGLPASWRRLGRTPFVRALVVTWRWLTQPLTATLLHSAALWAWHAPYLFNAALHDESIHTAEHVSFFGTALLFWSAMIRRSTAPAFGALLVLLVFVQCGMLGAILTLAPQQLYAYGDKPMLWGLSGIEDQQIAGLLMWAPAGLAYMAPFAWLGSKVLRDPYLRERSRESPSCESHGIMRTSTSSRSMK